jgi:hypothetical protein
LENGEKQYLAFLDARSSTTKRGQIRFDGRQAPTSSLPGRSQTARTGRKLLVQMPSSLVSSWWDEIAEGIQTCSIPRKEDLCHTRDPSTTWARHLPPDREKSVATVSGVNRTAVGHPRAPLWAAIQPHEVLPAEDPAVGVRNRAQVLVRMVHKRVEGREHRTPSGYGGDRRDGRNIRGRLDRPPWSQASAKRIKGRRTTSPVGPPPVGRHGCQEHETPLLALLWYEII